MKTMKTVDLAKDIVYFCNKNGISFNLTKIQKLLYIFVGYALVNNLVEDEDNVVDEMPQAWPYGPVFKKVYDNYTNIEKSVGENYVPSIHNTIAENILERTVIPKWGEYSAKLLSDWSHEPGSPWDYVIGTKRGGWGAAIDFYLIKPYFEKLNQIEPTVC